MPFLFPKPPLANFEGVAYRLLLSFEGMKAKVLIVTKACTLLLFFTCSFSKMEAQTKVSSPAGEYYLRGVPETASGFKLNADSTFEFFFSYGALDRSGKGRWRVQNKAVIFNSGPKPPYDFALVKSTVSDTGKISISIKDENEQLLRYMHCKITGGGKEQEGTTDEKGGIEFTVQPIETIELFFEFCPEKKSVFTIPTKGHHTFEFSIEPWLMDVIFQNFRLTLTKEGLAGGHPLSGETSFRYDKSKPSKM
ncbi:MAG TPA: hypothetical protein VEY10_21455 [Flavisolibacter sp.]|nr:hypothetical protein [Flavisolibacter sp.]